MSKTAQKPHERSDYDDDDDDHNRHRDDDDDYEHQSVLEFARERYQHDVLGLGMSAERWLNYLEKDWDPNAEKSWDHAFVRVQPFEMQTGSSGDGTVFVVYSEPSDNEYNPNRNKVLAVVCGDAQKASAEVIKAGEEKRPGKPREEAQYTEHRRVSDG